MFHSAQTLESSVLSKESCFPNYIHTSFEVGSFEPKSCLRVIVFPLSPRLVLGSTSKTVYLLVVLYPRLFRILNLGTEVLGALRIFSGTP